MIHAIVKSFMKSSAWDMKAGASWMTGKKERGYSVPNPDIEKIDVANHEDLDQKGIHYFFEFLYLF